jgi:hypothetical protein
VGKDARENGQTEHFGKGHGRHLGLDDTRNTRGQAMAAPYGVRPWPGATVSTPLKWSEGRKGLMTYLFANFLTDHAAYMEARHYWESTCIDLLGSRASDWETWSVCNGSEDGNPIYAMLSRRLKRAVRIIQVPANVEEAWEREPISSWIDSMGDDLPGSIVVDELVVHCVLSLDTAKAARQIIGKWFDDSYKSG